MTRSVDRRYISIDSMTIMDVTELTLMELRKMCISFYNDEKEHIRSIILYGSAARAHLGHGDSPGDFDLNMFFSDKSAISSTHGMPKIIGELDGLEVEVMRNKVADEISIDQYVDAQQSKRWKGIQTNPVVQIYPTIKRKSWG
ncbi:hypothetical protein [Halorarum halobium]|uniref:hypothetical protein n=1 Tax=Halorarum halobium TaxID=3075121 RepID=UPI0028A9CCEC|nr:hypothetical protein [Halobaculum sp. XH14]